jgi:hypothetical protein
MAANTAHRIGAALVPIPVVRCVGLSVDSDGGSKEADPANENCTTAVAATRNSLMVTIESPWRTNTDGGGKNKDPRRQKRMLLGEQSRSASAIGQSSVLRKRLRGFSGELRDIIESPVSCADGPLL